MAHSRTRILAAVAAAAMAASLAACGGGSDTESESGSKGGTLYYFLSTPMVHADPQRMYSGQDVSNLGRTVYRSLVAFPISPDPGVADKPVPDLATDTGTASDGAKTWSFTIKDGVRWQDGKDITCEDFRYGASRVFATDVIVGGPHYLLSYLDVPPDPTTGLPSYDGPYQHHDQAAFDRAVTCEGRTITYHFKKPWADFNLAVAALGMMNPFRKDKDEGEKSNFQIFSNGPYQLEGTWSKANGGTFVRNPRYDPQTDSPDLRRARPDTIVFDIGDPAETICDRLVADAGHDKNAVTGVNVPPAFYSQVTGGVARRAVNVESPYVVYLAPNVKRLRDLKVRRALLLATDVRSWILAGGGDKAKAPAKSIVNPIVVGYQDNPNLAAPLRGGPAAAERLLQEAGVRTPYPIKFTYPSSETMDKQAAALKEGWEAAGFRVTLDGMQKIYDDAVSSPDADSDVVLGVWGADWPSAVTVTPPLFDSRVNLTEDSNGQDPGNYASDEFNQLVDEAQGATSLEAQTAALQRADEVLGRDVAYIPLEIAKFYLLRGSHVTGYETTPASSMYPDLGPIGLRN